MNDGGHSIQVLECYFAAELYGISWNFGILVANVSNVGISLGCGNLQNFAKDIDIHVRPHHSATAEVTSDLVESWSYEHRTFHEACGEKELPLKMFEAQPVVVCDGNCSEACIETTPLRDACA